MLVLREGGGIVTPDDAKQLADLQTGARPTPADYAASLWNVASRLSAVCQLGIVAGGIDELQSGERVRA